MANNEWNTPLDAKVSRVVGNKPGATHHQQDARWKEAVQQRLETSLPEQTMPTVSAGTGITVTPSGDDYQVALTTPVSIANGGTGAGTATAAFNALDPLATKGDLITHDGTNSVRQAVGANNTIVVADNTQANGLKWQALESVPHGERVRVISATSGQRAFPNNSTFTADAAFSKTDIAWFSASGTAGGDKAFIPLDLHVGERIKSVKMYGATGGTTSGWTLKVWKKSMTVAAASQLGTTQSTSGAGAGDDNLSVTGLTEVVAAGTQYYAEWSTSGTGTSTRRCYGVELTYDHP